MAEPASWHVIEAKREGDELPTMFRIRDIAPRPDLPTIYVVELPYPVTDASKLPAPSAHRRLGSFEDDWLTPACEVLGLELVGVRTGNGSMFAYLYGAADPQDLIARLSPFDGALGFYDDPDPTWSEYQALQELLTEARAARPKPRATTVVEKSKPKKQRAKKRR